MPFSQVTEAIPETLTDAAQSLQQVNKALFYKNPWESWAWAVGSFFAVYIVLNTLRALLAGRVQKWNGESDVEWRLLLKRLILNTKQWLFLAFALEVGSMYLVLPAQVQMVIHKIPFIALIVQLGIWGGLLVEYVLKLYVYRHQDEAKVSTAATLISPMKIILKFGVWAILFLLLLDNFGFNITTLVASLGIGGIAVAFALQKVLEDVFASLAIVIDKPFVLGDFITVDDFLGTVEKIGMKTTRIRSLSGEELIVSNSDLLSSRIRNYKTMARRRVVFRVGVLYSTPPALLKEIPGMIRGAIEGLGEERAEFDRAHLAVLEDSSITFEAVYYVLSGDYTEYMDTQQAIYLEMIEQFAEKGIDFAFPSRTVYLETDKPVQGKVEAIIRNTQEPSQEALIS